MIKQKKILWRVSVATSPEAEDAVGELLAGLLGVAAVAYFDWQKQTSLVSIFVESGKFSPAAVRQEISSGLKRIAGFGLPAGAGKIIIARVKPEDWAESWKRHFLPLEIGAKLLVKPSWSRRLPRKNQAVVILDPGLSFGTGQHPTTSFCLNAIVHCHIAGKTQSFLDIGTGSGILAIAAAKLGYQPVHAFDFDPESIRVAKENARINQVQDRVKPAQADLTRLSLMPARKFDLVCANLLSNLLLIERRRIVNRLKTGGTLVLAGILAAEFGAVRAAFEDLGLKLTASRVDKEWCSGSFCFG